MNITIRCRNLYKGFILLSLTLFYISSIAAQQRIDTLLSNFKNASSPDQRIAAANQLNTFLFKAKALTGLHILTPQSPEDSLLMVTYTGIGIYYYDLSDYQRCIHYCNIALEPAKRLKDSTALATIYDFTSSSYVLLGFYEQAQQQLQAALKLAEETRNEEGMGFVYSNFGALFIAMKKEKQAIEMYTKAIEIARKMHNDIELALRLSKMGEIYLRLEQPDHAIPFFREALELDLRTGNVDKIARRQSNLANAYRLMELYSEAEVLYREAINTFRTVDNKRWRSIACSQMGLLKIALKQWSEAEEYCKEAETMAKAIGLVPLEIEACQGLYEVYKHTNPTLAFEYIERRNLLSDSIFRLESEKQVNEFLIRYETVEKENRIALQQAEISRKNQLQWVLVGGIAVSLIILYIVNHFRRTIRQRNRELKQMNAMKDKLFSIISHDLKSPIAAQKLAVDGMLDNFGQSNPEQLQKNLYDFQQATAIQLNLLQNLLSWAKMQMGLIQPKPSTFDMASLVNEVSRIYRLPADNKQLEMNIDVAPGCFVHADWNMIHTVMRNLINNAIKFSHPGGQITIAVIPTEQTVRVAITDNGIGMTAEQIDNLLNHKENTSTPGTQGEKGSGLGLVICREMLECNHATLAISSRPKQGTTISFELKKQ